MRRGRKSLRDLFYNTGDMNVRTVDESFGVSRAFSETISEGMLEDERIKQARLKRAQERASHTQESQSEGTVIENPEA